MFIFLPSGILLFHMFFIYDENVDISTSDNKNMQGIKNNIYDVGNFHTFSKINILKMNS